MRLFEIENNLESETFDNIWNNHIVKNCSDIIQVYQNNPNQFFYRGYKGELPAIFRDTPPTNREPLDSVLWISQLFDLSLEMLGHRALRSNSIFVTSSVQVAKAYGKPYFIFPVNSVDFTYTTWKDIVLSKPEAGKIMDNTVFNIINDQFPEIFKNKNLSLDQAIDYINRALAGKITITAEDLVDLDSVKKEFGPRKDDIITPLLKRREVCIHGPYYALNYDDYESEILYKLKRGSV